ncbi:MAG: carbohydrate ABC transporter permease [Candidatus Limnocylindrales bacterium]
MTGTTMVRGGRSQRRIRPQRAALHAFLIVISIVWLVPLLYAFYTSLRPVSDTIQHGYVSLSTNLNFNNYINVWQSAEIPYYYLNTLIVVIPGVILALFLASLVAFAVSRFSFRFNVALLMMFTAGNLLPPQVIIVPLYWLYLAIPVPELIKLPFVGMFPSDNGLLYDQYVGIILIHVVFQTGFCAFVLSNYMRTISKELNEAALVDGAGVWTIYSKVILPLCTPALAALATLEFTWIYNDFFWALLLMESGAKRPITSALNNLQGSFFINNNLLAAASLLAAIPTVIVFIALQRQFVRGLTLGSTKG